MSNVSANTGEIPTLGIGIVGYAFMGKAHSNAFKTLDYIYTPPPAHPSLVAIGGRDAGQVAAAQLVGIIVACAMIVGVNLAVNIRR